MKLQYDGIDDGMLYCIVRDICLIDVSVSAQQADVDADGGVMSITEDTRRKLIHTLVHEVLHVLYFSNWQFSNFLDLTTGQQIGRNGALVIDMLGRPALKTPNLVARAREHYGCAIITSVPIEDGGKLLALIIYISSKHHC